MSNWPVLAPRSSPAAGSPWGVRLDLPAHAEQVVVARHVVAALAESLRFSVAKVEDVKLAVTEACTNVVRHAYPDAADGRLQVAAATADGELVVAVTDAGQGPGPTPREDPISGLGMPLMAALTQHLAIERGGAGTTVRMSFAATE